VTRGLRRRLRRVATELVLGLVVVLGAVSVWQAWDIAGHLRSEARETTRIFGRIVSGLNDPAPGADTEILLELVGFEPRGFRSWSPIARGG
jgi:hypothetical protein